jgi:predicted GNAT family N-acyltransferase
MNNTSGRSSGNTSGNTSENATENTSAITSATTLEAPAMASAVDDCAQVIHESWQRRAASLPERVTEIGHTLSEVFEFREIVYGSAEYKTTLALRHKILREPLGLNLWHENLSVEIDQRHFTLWQRAGSLTGSDNNSAQMLACVVIVPKGQGQVKLRQMAVSSRFQRRGLGQRLIAAVEDIMVNEGVKQIELSARESAVAFYQASHYACEGPAYVEVGLPHQRMTKMLKPTVKPTNNREQK